MLHITSDEVGAYAIGFTSWPTSWGPNQIDAYDPLGRYICNCENIMEAVDLVSIAGYNSPASGLSKSSRYGYPPLADTKAYGRYSETVSYFNNIHALFSDWDFSSGALGKRTNENPVIHINVYGGLVAGGVTGNLYRLTYAEETEENPRTSFTIVEQDTYGHVTPLPPLGGSMPVGNISTSIQSLADEVNSGAWNQAVAPYGYSISSGFTCKYKDFQYIQDPSGLVTSCAYSIMLVYPVSGGARRTDTYAVKLTFTTSFNPHTADAGVSYPVSDFISLQVRRDSKWLAYKYYFSSSSTPSILWSHPDISVDWTNDVRYCPFTWYATPCIASRPGNVSDIDAIIGYSEPRYVDGPGTLAGFRKSIQQVAVDAYSTTFFSSKDAIDKHFEQMANNHIEALAELHQLFGIVSIPSLLQWATNQRRGPLLYRILNLLADAKLLYSFGIAPSLSDAQDVAHRSTAFRSKYYGGSNDIYRPNTIYGKYVLQDISLCTGYVPITLVSRSKLVVSVDPDSLLATLIPYDSLGLLPTLSRLWDLVPFSFVVDWFTKFGDSTSDFESSLMFLAMDIHQSVHSIKYIYELPDEVISNAGVSRDWAINDGQVGYSYYERWALDSLPVLTPTRLPIYQATGVPDWTLVGALAVKFL